MTLLAPMILARTDNNSLALATVQSAASIAVAGRGHHEARGAASNVRLRCHLRMDAVFAGVVGSRPGTDHPGLGRAFFFAALWAPLINGSEPGAVAGQGGARRQGKRCFRPGGSSPGLPSPSARSLRAPRPTSSSNRRCSRVGRGVPVRRVVRDDPRIRDGPVDLRVRTGGVCRGMDGLPHVPAIRHADAAPARPRSTGRRH